MNVPLRSIETYQTDDGRRVEVFVKIKDVKFISPEEVEVSENDLRTEEKIYTGLIVVATMAGPREHRFEITGVQNIEEAFDRFYDFAAPAADELRAKFEEMKRQFENKVVTAPAETLNVLNQGKGNIIVP